MGLDFACCITTITLIACVVIVIVMKEAGWSDWPEQPPNDIPDCVKDDLSGPM